MIIRSHDFWEKVICNAFGDRLITIFSSTNYCGVYQNVGALIFIKNLMKYNQKYLRVKNILLSGKNDWSKTNYPPSSIRNFQK